MLVESVVFLTDQYCIRPSAMLVESVVFRFHGKRLNLWKLDFEPDFVCVCVILVWTACNLPTNSALYHSEHQEPSFAVM